MKKLVLWIIKVFRLDITTEKVVEKVVEKEIYMPQNGTIEGDVIIKGNVTILGSLSVKGSLTIYKKEC